LGTTPEIEKTDISFGLRDSVNRLTETADQSPGGARAALETFYYAWHHADADVMLAVWADDPLAQLNNPLGGILRGAEAITALYKKALGGPANVTVTLGDVVAFYGPSHVVFAGQETGSYTAPDGAIVPLKIRTTRYFRYAGDHWRQYHHHGSIDDPDALRRYQEALHG
jgi:ketosteroid isomerase-like protein